MSDENALCPRCGQAFHCGAQDAWPCACASVGLTDATRQALRQQFSTCLCRACLEAVQMSHGVPPPASRIP